MEVIWANLLKAGITSKLPGPPVHLLQSIFLVFWHPGSQNHRITGWLWLEGTSGGPLVQNPCSSRAG